MLILKHDLLDLVHDSLPILVASLSSGEILYANASVEALFSYHITGELVGKNVDCLVPVDVRAKHKVLREGFAQYPKTRSMGADLNIHGQRQDGTTFPARVLLKPAKISGIETVMAIIFDCSSSGSSIH